MFCFSFEASRRLTFINRDRRRNPASARRDVSKLEFLREVVLKRELEMKVVRLEAIQEVLSFAVDQLTADHHVVNGIEQYVARCVVAPMEGVGSLSVGVLDVQY